MRCARRDDGRGRPRTLAVTAHGRRVRADPLALWWHLAERMPVTSADPITKQAGLLLLIAVAAGVTDDLHDTIAGLLGAIGWIGDDGTPMTPLMASYAAWDNAAVLRWLDALSSPLGQNANAGSEGSVFTRAALVTWPGVRR